MRIKIPTNYHRFAFRLFLSSKGNIPLKIMVKDHNKPNTFYYNRNIRLKRGQDRIIDLKFPSSPAELDIDIFNPAIGQRRIGEDNSFKLERWKIGQLRTCDTWWTEDDMEFYNFAVQFSENAAILKAGNNKPQVYVSDNGKYHIHYYDVIKDRKAKKMLSTPARIGHQTGTIEVSKKYFLKYTVPMRLIILLHEYSHKFKNPTINRPIGYETGADINALSIYLGRGWSEVEAERAFLTVFRGANNESNHKRYKILHDFIGKYSKGLIEKCNIPNPYA